MRTTGLTALLLVAPAALVASATPASAAAPSCDRPTIVGTSHGDRLVGTDGPDVIAGLGGRDVLDGRGGDDLLCGGRGADVLLGGPGDDELRGGLDQVTRDAMIGRMSVGDRLDGGPGDDLLDGGHDRRTDEIPLDNAQLDTLDFRGAPQGVTVRLDRSSAQGYGADRIVVRGRYEVRATRFADVVHGTDRAEEIYTLAGPDVVRAGGGGDWVSVDGGPRAKDDDVAGGGPGDDYLFAAGGSDRLAGGGGSDQVSDEGLAGVDHLRGGGGNRDLVTNVISAASGESADGGAGSKDYLWNTDEAGAFPDATMTCRGFETMRDSGPWC